MKASLARMIAATAAAAMLGSCGLFGGSGPITIAAIGRANLAADPASGALTPGEMALLAATAQGVVAYDGDGQIDTGVAERWTVTGDGLSYIFRIRPAKWASGRTVNARDVAAILNRYRAAGSRHRLAREFAEVESVRAMTDHVVEIRLKSPQPFLLELLAHPSMSLPSRGQGWGPMRAKREGRTFMLTPMPDPLAEDAELAAEEAANPERAVAVIARPAAKALARYKNGYADGVIGGRFQDMPYFVASDIARSDLVVDPTYGLFGLMIVGDNAFLDSDVRRDALSMALRRTRMIGAFGLQEWQAEASMRPALNIRRGMPQPVFPAWYGKTAEDRRTRAAEIVARYKAERGEIAPLRIALPAGPGSRILYAYLAADLNSIGVPTRRVTLASDADLRLLDEVAPYDDPIWPLRRLSCAAGVRCEKEAEAALDTASSSRDMAERARLIGEAEVLMAGAAGYIPLAYPLRWSVKSSRLTGFKANPRAQHPLNRLVIEPN